VATSFYETLIQKAQAINTAERSATVQELEQICREELNHFHLLWDCIERLGADLTVETPSADVSALASRESESLGRPKDDFRAMPRSNSDRRPGG
jgi:tRNA isopentenyl-2-thiomethyl-A-37 hydroxylase MiaE